MAKKLTEPQKTILQNATLKPLPAYKIAGYDLFLTVQARGSCLWSLVRHGYLEAHPDYYGGRMEQCYILTPAGAEVVGREDLFPLYDAYKTYRRIAWDGGYTALGYNEWYKVQPESADTGNAPLAPDAAPVGDVERKFEIGQRVRIKLDADTSVDGVLTLEHARDSREIGTVCEFMEDNEPDCIRAEFGGRDIWRFQLDELEPAEPEYAADNPYPPYTPGALADDTIASYEHTIAALQAQLTEAQAALREARDIATEELGDWSAVHFDHLPEALEGYYRIREAADRALNVTENAAP